MLKSILCADYSHHTEPAEDAAVSGGVKRGVQSRRLGYRALKVDIYKHGGQIVQREDFAPVMLAVCSVIDLYCFLRSSPM